MNSEVAKKWAAKCYGQVIGGPNFLEQRFADYIQSAIDEATEAHPVSASVEELAESIHSHYVGYVLQELAESDDPKQRGAISSDQSKQRCANLIQSFLTSQKPEPAKDVERLANGIWNDYTFKDCLPVHMKQGLADRITALLDSRDKAEIERLSLHLEHLLEHKDVRGELYGMVYYALYEKEIDAARVAALKGANDV